MVLKDIMLPAANLGPSPIVVAEELQDGEILAVAAAYRSSETTVVYYVRDGLSRALELIHNLTAAGLQPQLFAARAGEATPPIGPQFRRLELHLAEPL
jgi:hypothetical protein